MNIMVLGSGGREHALAWKISQSEKCSQLFIAPGNAGTRDLGQNVNINISDFGIIENFIREKHIELLVIGPEDPLVNGLRDYLESAQLTNLKIIGPGKKGAQLEGSKDFSKRFMKSYGIPTARFASFTLDTLEQAFSFLRTMKPPYVLKADGLAAGKGVIICPDLVEAEKSLREMLVDKKFGKASESVLIEEFLDGIELSVFILTDGKNYVLLPEAKDYKRIGEGDTGLNTGGMGAVSPVSFASPEFLSKVRERVIVPTLHGLQTENIDYKGFIFIGLMNIGGDPYVIEYNVRMGDPETQVVIPRINSDLVDLFVDTGNGHLADRALNISDETACTVVMVSGGYPESYEKGHEIIGLEKTKDAIVFHAGTQWDEDKVVNNGGRVFAITAMDHSLQNALRKSYSEVANIHWKNSSYRSDIGQDLLKLNQ